MAISARDGLLRKLKEERDHFAFQFGSLEKFLTEVREERVVMNRDMKAYMSEIAVLGYCQNRDRLKGIESRLLKVRTKSKRLSYQGRQLMASLEKELWEMDIEIIRLSKHVLGETNKPNMPHPDCPQTPRQEKSDVTPSTRADIGCRDHVKILIEPAETLAGPQKTDSSIAVDSKKLPKNYILQKPHTDICTQLEERDRFGFELSQFEKILVEIRKKRISFNKQMKLLLNDIAALHKVTQSARLNSLKTKVTTYRNQSKRLSYEGRQLLQSMQNDLWDKDLQIIRVSGHCDKDVRREVLPPVRSCLPHPDGPPMISNTSVAYKNWNSKVSDAANDEDVNVAMTFSTTSTSTAVRSARNRIVTIKRQTFCSRKVMKRPVSAPCLFKLAKKRKGMMAVSNTSIASTSTDKPDTAGNQVLVRPTKKETVETETSQKSSHDNGSVIRVHLKQKKKVHSTATSASNISHSTFRKSEYTMPGTHVKLTKRKKVPSATTSSYISSEGILKNLESTMNSNQVSLTQNEADPTAANASHIFSQCTFKKADHTMPAAQVKLMQEEPLTAPTNPTNQSFCSSDELEKKSYSSASQVKLTWKLSTDSNSYEIPGRARPTLLTLQSTKMSPASFSIPGLPPTSGVGVSHSLTPVTMTDAAVWNGTALKTQVRPRTAPTQSCVTAGTLTRSHRNIGLKEAQTILEILKMQRDLLVTSICGIQSELDLGKQEDCIWRSRMDELNTELQQIKTCPNSHRVASIRAKAAYLKVQMSNLQLFGNIYLNNMDSVISHLTGEIRGVSCKIMAALPFNIDVNISSRCTNY